MTTSNDVIEQLVTLTYGSSDLRTQTLFRTNLAVLVELAKAEQRRELNEELPELAYRRTRHSIH